MKINKIISQHRRDIICEYICEYCDNTHDGTGYDDDHFYNNVVPSMVCKKCGKKADPEDYRGLSTKYQEGQIV